VKSGAAVLGAIAGAVTALYGVYEKVRSDAKQYTAASYNTLAPQMNQIGEALKQLQQENQQLREIVAAHQGTPRIAERPPAAAAPRRPARKPGAVASAPTAGQPAAGQPASGQPAGPTAAAGQPPAGQQPAAAPSTPSQTPPAGPAPAAGAPGEANAAPAPAAPADPVGGLLNTVGRTRQAIESLRKVPEDFENVLGKKK
jgi:hypothetical protein